MLKVPSLDNSRLCNGSLNKVPHFIQFTSTNLVSLLQAIKEHIVLYYFVFRVSSYWNGLVFVRLFVRSFARNLPLEYLENGLT